jgi:hypothetical protein
VATDEEDIYIDPSDSTAIVLAKPGFYKISYLLTPTTTSGDVQFSLHLDNGITPIPGSTYAIGNSTAGDEAQLVGDVLFVSGQENAALRLWNQSDVDAALSNQAGTDDSETWGNNVSASITIFRIAKLD